MNLAAGSSVASSENENQPREELWAMLQVRWISTDGNMKLPLSNMIHLSAWFFSYWPTSANAPSTLFCLTVSRPGTAAITLYGGWSDQHSVSPGPSCQPSRTSTGSAAGGRPRGSSLVPATQPHTPHVVQERPHPQQQIQGQFLLTSHQDTHLLKYWTVYITHCIYHWLCSG